MGEATVNERRPVGALEHAVLECLWSAESALAPREVLDRLGSELAYTTVVTILTRLAAKGMVEREKDGRVFRYLATRSEADVLADRMQATLAAAGDREATLSRFAEGLSGREADALRDLLADLEQGGRGGRREGPDR
jgi:predicted transcriptional regulator